MSEISKKYPEFGLLIFKWSHEGEWNELTKWEKISYAIDIKKIMKKNNVTISFTETYRQLNGSQLDQEEGEQNQGENNIRRARMSVISNNAVSYEQFNNVYAKYHAAMFQDQATKVGPKQNHRNIIMQIEEE